MSKIISIHSYRGGTGKSNSSANIAALLAAQGQRVGVVDTDIQSPGIHILFGMPGEEISHSLNDYLWGKADIHQAAHDVTPNLGADVPGRVFLIPSSVKPGDITRILREGYDAKLLTHGFRNLIKELDLDTLVIDTPTLRLNEETLLSIVISHALIIILRPDQQDYEGTSITVQVARKLRVPSLMLMVNKVPAVFDTAAVKAKVEQTYDCEVAAVLPHSDELMALASSGVFSMRYPDHPVTALYKQVVTRLMA